MTQEELNRLNEARKLECDIDILRKASLIVSNSPLVSNMSADEKQDIFYNALQLVEKSLPNLFEEELSRLRTKFQKL